MENEDGISEKTETQHCKLLAIMYDFRVNSKLTTMLREINSTDCGSAFNVLVNCTNPDVLRCAVTKQTGSKVHVF